ncbi:MAG: preprotein translocase subunit Sec61beta [Candidatus Pacearchaeota archaeon]|nr:preprotein translocase subunit Sec61beta [Candidatus Pacearchaeota archaeon]
MANMSMPSGFGGLLRYDEEYESKFMLKPVHVLVFVALVVVFRLALGWIF